MSGWSWRITGGDIMSRAVELVSKQAVGPTWPVFTLMNFAIGRQVPQVPKLFPYGRRSGRDPR